MSVAICVRYASNEVTRSALLLADALSACGNSVVVFSSAPITPARNDRWDSTVSILADTEDLREVDDVVWFCDAPDLQLLAPAACRHHLVLSAITDAQITPELAARYDNVIVHDLRSARALPHDDPVQRTFLSWSLIRPILSAAQLGEQTSTRNNLAVFASAAELDSAGIFLPSALVATLAEFRDCRATVLVSGSINSELKQLWRPYLGGHTRVNWMRNPHPANRNMVLDSCAWVLNLNNNPVSCVDTLEALWRGVPCLVPDTAAYADLVYTGVNGCRVPMSIGQDNQVCLDPRGLVRAFRQALSGELELKAPPWNFLENRRQAFMQTCKRLLSR